MENDLVGFVKRRWILVALTTVACIAMALATAPRQSNNVAAPRAVAASSFVVRASQPSERDGEGQMAMLQQQCANSARLAATSLILKPLASHMNATFPTAKFTELELADAVKVNCIGNTTLVEAVATMDTDEEAVAAAEKARDLVAEQLEASPSGKSVDVDFRSDATLRTSPAPSVKSERTRLLTLATLGGLILGSLLALGVELLRRRVRSRDDVARITDVPVWAEVGEQRDEGFRRARAKLLKGDPSVVACAPATGEAAAHSSTLELASSIAASGRRVAVVMDRDAPAQLTEGVDIIPTGGLSLGQLLDTAKPSASIAELGASHDMVLLSCRPAAASADLDAAGRFADTAVLFLERGAVSPSQLRESLELMEAAGSRAGGIILDGKR